MNIYDCLLKWCCRSLPLEDSPLPTDPSLPPTPEAESLIVTVQQVASRTHQGSPRNLIPSLPFASRSNASPLETVNDLSQVGEPSTPDSPNSVSSTGSWVDVAEGEDGFDQSQTPAGNEGIKMRIRDPRQKV